MDLDRRRAPRPLSQAKEVRDLLRDVRVALEHADEIVVRELEDLGRLQRPDCRDPSPARQRHALAEQRSWLERSENALAVIVVDNYFRRPGSQHEAAVADVTLT